jgi:hypothetical protein
MVESVVDPFLDFGLVHDSGYEVMDFVYDHDTAIKRCGLCGIFFRN